jgi:alkanesulfonate monooxygenase SsuD/methylene tetrahydromethanopterin reductase-like flavin-dependent oxidoreductase (luciferase family)
VEDNMNFGAMIWPLPRFAAQQTKWVEEQGFTHAWFGDVPIAGGGDVYVCMALAAKATRTITLGTYIAPAPLRSPVVTVSSIGTINALAPGRVVLGFGSGAASLMLAGSPAMKVKTFRAQARLIRGLLQAGEGIQETAGVRRKVRFYNRDLRAFELDGPIPFFVAASAPKAAAVAGEFADGLITAGSPIPEEVAAVLEHAVSGARKAGRRFEERPYVMEGPICVLRKGEPIDSPRILEATQAFVMTGFKFSAHLRAPAEMFPAPARPAYQEYCAHVATMNPPEEERHLAIWEGCFMPRPDERRFVTPDAIGSMTLTGPLEEVVDRMKALEAVGLNHWTTWLPASGTEEYVQDLHAVRARL